MTDAVPDTR